MVNPRQFSMKTVRALFLAAAVTIPALRVSEAQQSETIVTADRIYTSDDFRPVVEALLIRGDRVEFAGSLREVRARATRSARTIAFPGNTIVPGMVDAHAHLLGLGESLLRVRLQGATTYDEVVSRIAARAANTRKGEWVTGRGWDQNLWPGKDFPSHAALSRAVPNNPVFVSRVDGHAGLANALAMKIAGVTAATRDPDGGRIIRDAQGNPTGVFVDNAKSLIERAIPASSRAQLSDAVLGAIAEANKWGLTGIHDAGESRQVIEIYEQLARAGKYNLRNYVMVSADSADVVYYTNRGPRADLYNGRLWVRTIKMYADGALGSRGAAMLQPYSDDPGNIGLLVTPQKELQQIADLALRKGFQVATHAIGDRGNRVALDVYDSALRKHPVADHRFRIEHAQVISLADIPRFAKLGVIPSMQGSHQTSDMGWAEDRVGHERIKGAYAWRSLIDQGSIIPNGSDFPVEDVNPLLSFHAAVTRQNPANQPPGGWYPEQRMTREEALKAMTLWPAYAGFQEKILGSLSPGKYADFVVLDRDIMRVSDDQILQSTVQSTWLGGKPVYRRGNN
jgi:predicted amidohydrolase YtcJ